MRECVAASDPEGAKMVPMHSRIDAMLLQGYLALVHLVLKGLRFKSNTVLST